MASGATKTEAKRVSNLKKKKEAHMASGGTENRGQKAGLYGLGFH